MDGVERLEVRPDKGWAEVFVKKDAVPRDADLEEAVKALGGYTVTGID